jgi:large subunit ribosomal protein L4
MLSVKLYNQNAEEVGQLELADKIFGVKKNDAVIHQVVVAHMANERQVLAHTKDRSEVRGGGKKPWKQKGTGRARQGSIRSPQWIGGGIVFGPNKERNFKRKINKKMDNKAMFMALSDRAISGNFLALDKLEIAEFKTKVFNDIITKLEAKLPTKKKLKSKRSILLINDKKDDKVKRSGKNLPGVEIINLNNINIIDLLKYKNLIMTEAGIKVLTERYK